MRSGEVGDVDSVDFTDDENRTVVTVSIPRSGDGMYIAHVMPMCSDDQIRVELHRGKGLAVIGSSTGRPEWAAACRPPRLPRRHDHSSRFQLWRPPSHKERRLE